MPEADHAADEFVYTPADKLRHDLKSPLTTIYARAYLLGRAIRRAPSLSDEDRTRMLAGVAAIEAAVREMVTAVDGIGAADGDGRYDPG
jgi:hypothetical protein